MMYYPGVISNARSFVRSLRFLGLISIRPREAGVFCHLLGSGFQISVFADGRLGIEGDYETAAALLDGRVTP